MVKKNAAESVEVNKIAVRLEKTRNEYMAMTIVSKMYMNNAHSFTSIEISFQSGIMSIGN
jgi:hypothetical protein